MGLTILRAVPLWAWALAAALAWGGWQHQRATAAGAELLRVQAETAALREKAMHSALIETTRRAAAHKGATDVYLARAQAARTDAAGTDAAYRSLLDAITASGGTADDPAAACRTAGERVGVLEGLLAEGAALAAEGARRVGALDAKLSGLQEHARVGQVPVTQP